MRLLMCMILAFCSFGVFAQNGDIIKGNRFYKDSAFDKAEEQYRKSISKKPTAAAQYNLGNTLYQKKQTKEAIEQFNTTAQSAEEVEVKAKALYNKGVVLHQNNELEEAIGAYKEALRLTPDDAEVRKNLQLALQNKNRKNPPPPKPKEQKKKEEKPKEQKKKQPPPPKLSKKQAEQYLKSLAEKERQLQEKMQKKVGVPSQPDKDW
jgi:Ca-activated chloride channel homolog